MEKLKDRNMKKVILMLVMAVSAITASAQKYALVDMEYILANLPAYVKVNQQLNLLNTAWQAEVEAVNVQASTLYKDYQNAAASLSQAQKKERQDSIMQKEKEASELKQKYFGPNGELATKREELLGPIQEAIYKAVKEVSNQHGYMLVIDRSSNSGIIFGSPKIDISNEVLQKLGYSK